MNYFYLNPNASNTIMQILILILLFVIGILMYTRPDKSDEIKKAISEIDVSCPPCPIMKGKGGKCPECICPETKAGTTSPEIKCPSVNDIVGGIFPGRNMGLTENGEYFPINAYEEQEIVPAYSSFINKVPAFKVESILGIDNKEDKKDNKDKKNLKLSTDKDPTKTKLSSELEMKGSGIEPTENR